MNGYDADSLFHLDCGTSTDGRSIGGKKRQPMMPHRVTLSRSERSVGAVLRDASLRLSMTGWLPMLLPAGVTLCCGSS